MDNERYKAIPLCAIIPGTLPDFQIYIRTSEGRFILWTVQGNKVKAEQLGRLSRGGHMEVFIDIEDEFKYDQHLEANLGDILENEYASDIDKSSIFTKVSTNIVKSSVEASMGMGTMDADAIQRTRSMVDSAMRFITASKSLHALVKLTGHDYQTYEHATKVLWFTVAFLWNYPDILDQINPDRETVNDEQRMEILKQCGVGALLHDIGKALIAPSILNKNGPLTEVEWEIVKRHPLSSLAMLVDSDLPIFVKKGILHHHENYHGGGYPMGLEGESITILARVLRIIDVFEAMTSRRPYKKAFSPLKALQIMMGKQESDKDQQLDERDNGMTQCFDEDLLRKFVAFLGMVK